MCLITARRVSHTGDKPCDGVPFGALPEEVWCRVCVAILNNDGGNYGALDRARGLFE